MRRAGYSEVTASTRSTEILKHPAVAAELARLRATIDERIAYTAETAFAEAGEAYDMAKKAGKPGDMVKAVALRAQIKGLLVEKHEVTNYMPDVAGVIAEMRSRQVQVLPARYPELVHDAQFTDVSSACDQGSSDKQSVSPDQARLEGSQDRG